MYSICIWLVICTVSGIRALPWTGDSMAFRSSKALKAGKQDRLSALPDAILCHILSCLQTKHAVATSVLSTRWKHLYRSVPVIDLDDTLDETEIEEGTGTEITYNGFIRFCNRVLLLRNGNDIAKFRLSFETFYDRSLIRDWVCAALCHNVQELDLCAGWDGVCYVSTEIFTHKRLLTLKLDYFAISIPHSVSLPNLRTLDLRYVKFPGGGGDLLKLFAGCKSMQNLWLEGPIREIDVFNLSIPSLRRLRMIYTDWHPLIDTPKLEYLCIISDGVYGFELKNLSSPRRATFEIPSSDNFSGRIDRLCTVKFLFLDGIIGKSSFSYFSLLSKLQYLEAVELCPGHQSDLGVVPQILNNTPPLQTLIVDMDKASTNYPEGHPFRLLDTKKPLCLARKLKKVEIENFSASEGEFEVREYLLQHGEVLESVSFKYSEGRDPAKVWTYSKLRRLLMFPRCSNICQVVLPDRNSS